MFLNSCSSMLNPQTLEPLSSPLISVLLVIISHHKSFATDTVSTGHPPCLLDQVDNYLKKEKYIFAIVQQKKYNEGLDLKKPIFTESTFKTPST